jgi:hypothetical protein
MLRGPIVVVAAVVVVKVAVIVVALTTVTPLMVRPAAGAVTWTVVPAGVKPVPVRVTKTAFPRRPEAGVIEVRVGVPGLTTVKVTGLLGPPAVLTITFLAVSAAVGAISNVASMVLSLTTENAVTVKPPPDTVTPVDPVKPTPEMMTGTEVP